MKTLILSGLTAFVLVVNAPKAQAGDEAIAAIGGLIGGILIGSAIDNHHDHYARDRYYDRGPRTKVVVRTSHRHGGYWKYTRIKTWVPGHWVREYDDCGNRRKYWVEGHYTYRKKKVWVRNSYSRHHNHRDRYCDDNDSYRRHHSRW